MLFQVGEGVYVSIASKNHQASVKSLPSVHRLHKWLLADKALNFFGVILEAELLSQGFDLWPYSEI